MDEEKIEELKEELGDLVKDFDPEDFDDEDKIAELRTKKEKELTPDEREELKKLREKEFNFKELRESNKKGKEDIKQDQDELAKEQKEFRENMQKERQHEALDLKGVNDEEARKKALLNFSRIDGPEGTKKEIFDKMELAVNMMGVDAPSVLQGQGHSGYRGTDTNKKETPESVEMRKDMRISDEEKKKYDGEWTPNIKPTKE